MNSIHPCSDGVQTQALCRVCLSKWYPLSTLPCRLLLLVYILYYFPVRVYILQKFIQKLGSNTGIALHAERTLAGDRHLDSPTTSALVTPDVWRDPCQNRDCAVLALHNVRALFSPHHRALTA